eukprot:COSAG02_NODE_2363_length_9059_cov_7.474219_9_plen_64_part_00
MQLIPCDNSFAGAASESLLVLGLSVAAFEALCDIVEGPLQSLTGRAGRRAPVRRVYARAAACP